MRILLLGGTSEARELATRLAESGHEVVSSLAGRVSSPELPDGDVRVGGFGGPDGLAAYLLEEKVDALVDATHPFAEHISANAHAAATQTGTRHLLLRRPGFPLLPEYAVVPDVHAAAEAIEPGSTVFLTIGRQQVAAFVHVDAKFVIRAIDPPSVLPPHHVLLLERGPFSLEDEIELIQRHGADTLVTKDSGGAATAAKLEAAAQLGLSVIVVARPGVPEGAAVVETVEQVMHELAG
ncbi:cobalt-precorrin-6A reductase [Nocardioides jiangxiensis]|uniref:Cobalt-precorrin-6A reductase n=1 Tax=Nocardioides jiangxiensis TaxID=3064524 RepID=A0ABT9AZW7_9ACTN|nr:cobalt-precorrin-6A reductase [Nocardioides sp. WY-20]MDO7867997.1 cobalt-precorrin-6A reductase [Nocardioides sp. WY-20]